MIFLQGEDTPHFDDEQQDGEDSTSNMVKNLVRKGDMVPQGTILDLVVEEMSQNPDVEGFFITGFPRDIVQAQGFEERVQMQEQLVVECGSHYFFNRLA